LIPAAASEVESAESGWYVVYTKPRQEERARENLSNQGYTCFLHTLRVERLRAGHRVVLPKHCSHATCLFILRWVAVIGRPFAAHVEYRIWFGLVEWPQEFHQH
jgi:hypothetical protein